MDRSLWCDVTIISVQTTVFVKAKRVSILPKLFKVNSDASHEFSGFCLL